jgi:polyribonucleotide nucleotidyltransferase
MFNNVPVKHEMEFEGKTIRLESGLLAEQATASILASCGGTTVLCVVTVGKSESRGDYFPLQIIYEERYYATGKIKSSQWSKREAKPNDNAILTGRLIDRSIRSLFNPNIRTEVQVVITVLSLDKINQPDTLAVIGTSAALNLCGFKESENLVFPSKTPLYTGPVSSIRIGLTNNTFGKSINSNLENDYNDVQTNIKPKFLINPTYEELENSDLDIVISGDGQNIVMVECGANIIVEDIIAEALKISSPLLKKLTDFQHEFLSKTHIQN